MGQSTGGKSPGPGLCLIRDPFLRSWPRESAHVRWQAGPPGRRHRPGAKWWGRASGLLAMGRWEALAKGPGQNRCGAVSFSINYSFYTSYLNTSQLAALLSAVQGGCQRDELRARRRGWLKNANAKQRHAGALATRRFGGRKMGRSGRSTVCVRATTRLTETAVGAIGFVPRLRVSGRECCGSSG
jgi:hypothetical protein